MKINYNELEAEARDVLAKSKHFVLATSANDRVTARTMSSTNIGLKIYFATDKNFTKFKQLEKNKNVAICIGNMQIEGTATIREHPLHESNKKFLELFKNKHPHAFETYFHKKNEIVIEVNPALIAF